MGRALSPRAVGTGCPGWGALLVAAALAGPSIGCGGDGPSPAASKTSPPASGPASVAASASAAGTASATAVAVSGTASAATASASATSSTSAAAPASASTPAARPQTVHCSPKGPKKVHGLGSRRTGYAGMLAAPDQVIVLTWRDRAAKAEVVAVPKDGSALGVLAEVVGAGPPTGLSTDGQAYYFAKGGKLHRVAAGGGALETVAEEFPKGFGLADGYAYGLRCDTKTRRDEVVRVSTAGGAVETTTSFDHIGKAGGCGYGTPVVAGGRIYVPEEASRRLLSLDEKTGAPTDLASARAFMRIQLLRDDKLFVAGHDGLFSVPARGGEVTMLEGALQAPFAVFGATPTHIVGVDRAAYASTYKLFRLPLAAGSSELLESLLDDVEGVAADDECVYLARTASFNLGGDSETLRIQAMGLP